MCRSCLGRCTAVSCCQNFRYLLRFYQSAAHPEQCSGNDADHIVKETISTNAKHDLITGLLNIKAVDRTYAVCHLFFFRTEAGKIVFSDQICSCFFHLLHIKLPIVKQRIQPAARIRKLPAADPVFIRLYRALKSRMEIRGHLTGILDADILRKTCVQCIGNPLCRHTRRCIKNRHVPGCMHA